jgi:hypothetical protein
MVRWATRLADKIVDIGQGNNGGLALAELLLWG